ncbi:MAG: VWA domain-containing protein [Pirellulales bacterium]|nr:VWA domain-containing protein [Pirellulales bacterium]
MNFGHPWVLFLLALPAVLLVVTWRRRGQRLVLPMDNTPVRSSRMIYGLVGLAESAPPLLLAVAIVLLAGPERLGDPVTKRSLTNIELCVDVSGSMTAEFGEGTRYDASMRAIDEFLDFRKGDAFGLTFFGNSVLHWVPLTSDTSAIRCSPPFMRPEVVPPWFGGTAIAKAVLACREVLTRRQEGDRMIVLVSDGWSFDLDNGSDVELAAKLKADRITVYAIHIGEENVPDPIVNLTGLTGGEVFEPGDEAGLAAVFQRIDAMQQTKLERTAPERQDFFLPCSITGLTLVGLSGVSLFGVRYTPW